MHQLKRRLATRLPWPRVLERRFIQRSGCSADFTGQITLLCIDTVREPLWVNWQGQSLCAAKIRQNAFPLLSLSFLQRTQLLAELNHST